MLQKTRSRGDDPDVGSNRFHDNGGDFARVCGKGHRDRCRIVVGQDDRLRRGRVRDPRAARYSVSRPAPAGIQDPGPGPSGRRFGHGRMSLALARPSGRGIEGEFNNLSRGPARRFHIRSDTLLKSRSGELERETRFELATFCLGSPELVSVVA